MLDENMKVKKSNKPVDRVTIDESLRIKLDNLVSEANEVLDGISVATKSDIVNILISSHAGKLSSDEIRLLKESHVDPVKVAAWVSRRMKAAAKAGEHVSIQDLYKRCMSAIGETAPRVQRRKPKAKQTSPNDERSELKPLIECE